MILITGCSSKAGSELTNILSKNYKVKGFDETNSHNLPKNFHLTEGTLLDYEILINALKGVDTIIHMKDMRYPGKNSRQFMKDINITGTENLLKAAVELEIKKIIFISTTEVYGKPKGIPVKEFDSLKPRTTYGKDKKQAEKICFNYSSNNNINIIILRIPSMSYPETKDQLTLALLHNALTNGYDNKFFISKNLCTHMPLLHLSDFTNAVVQLLSTEIKNDIFNLSSDNVPTIIEEVIEVKKKCNLDFHISLYNPFLLRKPLIPFVQSFGKYHLRKALKYMITTDLLLDCDKAKKKLNWRPKKNNIDIIIETVNWYKEEGKNALKNL